MYADEEEEKEEEEEDAPPAPVIPFFGFGAKKQAPPEPEEEEEEEPSGLFAFGTRRIKARAMQSGRVQEQTPAQVGSACGSGWVSVVGLKFGRFQVPVPGFGFRCLCQGLEIHGRVQVLGKPRCHKAQRQLLLQQGCGLRSAGVQDVSKYTGGMRVNQGYRFWWEDAQ